MAATASFVIDFGGIEDAYLTAELDSVRNNEKSSFLKGDQVHFRVMADVNYSIEVTSGTILNGNFGVLELVENEVLSFIKGEPAGVSKKIASSINDPSPIKSFTWYPNDGNLITQYINNTDKTSTFESIVGSSNLGNILPVDLKTVQAVNANKDTLGIASVSYNTDYNQHTVVPPAGMSDIWHIIVYIKAIQ